MFKVKVMRRGEAIKELEIFNELTLFSIKEDCRRFFVVFKRPLVARLDGKNLGSTAGRNSVEWRTQWHDSVVVWQELLSSCRMPVELDERDGIH